MEPGVRESGIPNPAVPMRTEPRPNCPLCAGPGAPLYSDVRDRWFGVPGVWGIRRCSDPGCAVLWLDPAPIDEDLGRAYDTYYTHDSAGADVDAATHSALAWLRRGYWSLRFGYPALAPAALNRALGTVAWLFPVRREDLDLRLLELRAHAGGRLLDVGCGNGYLLAHMQSLGWNAEGIDLDPRAIACARAVGLTVRQGSLEQVRHDDASFDVVMFVDVLHHTDDAGALLKEAARVARKALVIKDHPRNGFLAGPTLRFMDWVANRRHGIALPYNYWTREKWFETFDALGLTVEEWKTKLGLYKPLGWLFGRGLHFVAKLEVASSAQHSSPPMPASASVA